MARLHSVAKARKQKRGQPKCGSCGTVIEVGSPYLWWATRRKGQRSGTKHVRCAAHRPRPSEMAHGYRASSLAASEQIDDAIAHIGSPEELADELRSAAETVRDECAVALRESASNIVDGFGHETSMSDELNERADAFDAWADEIESAADDIASRQDAWAEIEASHADHDGDFDDCPECDSARSELLGTIEGMASDAAQGSPE